jgi:hypothetical protein
MAVVQGKVVIERLSAMEACVLPHPASGCSHRCPARNEIETSREWALLISKVRHLLHYVSPELARNGPQAMSALSPLSG